LHWIVQTKLVHVNVVLLNSILDAEENDICWISMTSLCHVDTTCTFLSNSSFRKESITNFLNLIRLPGRLVSARTLELEMHCHAFRKHSVTCVFFLRSLNSLRCHRLIRFFNNAIV
jgi:hypothetical protein